MKALFCILIFLAFPIQIIHADTYFFNTSTLADSNLNLRKAVENATSGQASFSALLTGTFKVGTWETIPLGLTSLAAGTYTFNVWTQKQNLVSLGNINSKVYVNNTSNLIGTSSNATINTTKTKSSFTLVTSSPTVVNPTDKILIELYVNITVAAPVASNFLVFWGTTTDNSSVTMPFGGVKYLAQQSSASLGSVTKTTGSQISGSLGTITVLDGSESGSGWTLSGASTDFTSGGHSISVTSVKVNPSNGTFAVLIGSSTGVTAGSQHTFTSTSDQTTLLSATSTHGEGEYTINPDLTISIPANAYIGSYSGTLTITLV